MVFIGIGAALALLLALLTLRAKARHDRGRPPDSSNPCYSHRRPGPILHSPR